MANDAPFMQKHQRAIMLVLVSFVGLAVVRYSRNYLDGSPEHVRFTKLLLLTLASVEAHAAKTAASSFWWARSSHAGRWL